MVETVQTSNIVRKHIREYIAFRRSLAAEQLFGEIRKGKKLFGYVQCDIEVPQNLRAKLFNFPSIFKKTLVSKNNNGDSWKTYAKEEVIKS